MGCITSGLKYNDKDFFLRWKGTLAVYHVTCSTMTRTEMIFSDSPKTSNSISNTSMTLTFLN